MSDVKFVDGLRAYRPSERAPEFVKANLTIQRDELMRWLQSQPEKLRLDLKEARNGNWYLAVNDYKPDTSGPRQAVDQPKQPSDMPEITDDEIPFMRADNPW